MTTTLSLVPLHALASPGGGGVQVTSGPYILVRATTVAQDLQNKRILKKQENFSPKEPEALRCKRRSDSTGLHNILPRPQPAAVARRNERERNRVKMVNLGFETLREHVPSGKKNKKMSKVDTLRAAVDYIKQLQEILRGESENMNLNSPNSSESGFTTIDYPTLSDNREQFVRSVPTEQHSPAPSLASDALSESFSSEEDDLPDLGSWFS